MLASIRFEQIIFRVLIPALRRVISWWSLFSAQIYSIVMYSIFSLTFKVKWRNNILTNDAARGEWKTELLFATRPWQNMTHCQWVPVHRNKKKSRSLFIQSHPDNSWLPLTFAAGIKIYYWTYSFYCYGEVTSERLINKWEMKVNI